MPFISLFSEEMFVEHLLCADYSKCCNTKMSMMGKASVLRDSCERQNRQVEKYVFHVEIISVKKNKNGEHIRIILGGSLLDKRPRKG